MQVVDAMVQQGLHVSRDVLYYQLQLSSKKKDLAAGRKVHFFVISKGLDTVAVFVNHILRFYVACGSLDEANQVFENSKPNVFSYNAIMSAHAKLGDGNKTLELFDRLQADRLNPDTCTFLSVLSACGKVGAARQGRKIHSQIIQEGLDVHVAMSNTVIDMYAKCASLDEGRRVFDGLLARDVVSWAAIIAGYMQHGYAHIVLELFEKMKAYDLNPNDVIFSCVLKASSKLGAIHNGRYVHEEIIRIGLESADVVVTALVDMYAKCENLEDARRVFDEIASSNVIIWNAIIMGYAQHGSDGSALILFEKLLEKGIRPDKVTYLGVLKACGNERDSEQGRLLHHVMVQSGLIPDITLRNSFMNMYAKCGSMQDAQTIFDNLPSPDVLSWGTIIDGYAEHEYGFLALEAFVLMQQQGIEPNDVTFVSSLKACINNGSVKYGRKLHDQVVKGAMESSILVGSTIIDMYAKYGNLEEASNCFDRLLDPDVVAWGAMISGYIQMGYGDLGLEMFAEMLYEGIEPSEGIFVTILQACVSMDSLEPGSLLHEYIIKRGIQTDGPVGTILVHMYARFGNLEDARVVFNSHSNRDVVTWGAMIAGYVQHTHHISAVELFGRMFTQKIQPNRVIFLCILKSCSSIGSILHARMVHKEIIETGLELDVAIGNTLVDMYTKCGSEDDAREVLGKLCKKDVVSWSAVLGGHSRHGDSRLSMKCFEAMKQEGLRPDDAVFTNILAACSHEGSLEKGLVCFREMAKDHDVMPGFQHYYSIVDLLGRAGLFKEAEDVLHSMPNSENITGWTSLLSGCRTYGNVQVGQKCFDAIAELVPNDASSFMLMSNIYRDSLLW
eukprot:c22758_g4_i1 orf=512-3034(-)